MLRRSFLTVTSALVALSLAACKPMAQPLDSPGPVAVNGTYQLTRLNGKAFTRTGTIVFDESGIIAGQGPCNNWNGGRWDNYPDIRIEQLAVTRMGCRSDADSVAEGAFHAALKRVDHAEFTDGGLILTGKNGTRMEFTRAD